MKNIGRKKTEKSVLYAVCLGLGCAVILSAIFTGVITALISDESLSFNTVNWAIPAIQFLSAFFGSMISGLTVRDNKALSAGVVSGVYYLMLVGTSALLMNGISGKFWVGLITTASGCLAAIYFSTREKSSVKRRKRRRAHS